MTKNYEYFGQVNNFMSFLGDIIKLDGQNIDASNLPMQSNFIKLEKTKEEAIRRARLESIKKGLPFKEPSPVNHNKEKELMANKLMEDMIERIIRNNDRNS